VSVCVCMCENACRVFVHMREGVRACDFEGMSLLCLEHKQ